MQVLGSTRVSGTVCCQAALALILVHGTHAEKTGSDGVPSATHRAVKPAPRTVPDRVF